MCVGVGGCVCVCVWVCASDVGTMVYGSLFMLWFSANRM